MTRCTTLASPENRPHKVLTYFGAYNGRTRERLPIAFQAQGPYSETLPVSAFTLPDSLLTGVGFLLFPSQPLMNLV